MSDVQAGLFSAQLLFATQPETPVANQQVHVYAVGTTTPVTTYTDDISGTAAANPVLTDQLGNLSFYAAPGFVDIEYAQGDVLVRQTVFVPKPEAAIAVTNPTVVSGTAQQNTTAEDQTWEIPLTSTGAGTIRIQKGPTNSVATTDTGTLAVATTVTEIYSTILPAGWWIKITVANGTLGTIAAFNR